MLGNSDISSTTDSTTEISCPRLQTLSFCIFEKLKKIHMFFLSFSRPQWNYTIFFFYLFAKSFPHHSALETCKKCSECKQEKSMRANHTPGDDHTIEILSVFLNRSKTFWVLLVSHKNNYHVFPISFLWINEWYLYLRLFICFYLHLSQWPLIHIIYLFSLIFKTEFSKSICISCKCYSYDMV